MRQWSLKEIEDAGNKAYATGQGMGLFTVDAIAAIMTRAVELLQARGGTMTAERVEMMLSVAAEWASGEIALLRQHITAQGATVATLQAKVERDKAILDAAISAREELKGEVKALRAEVKRLMALSDVLTRTGAAATRDANSAESRLAAIRERAIKAEEAAERARAAAGVPYNAFTFSWAEQSTGSRRQWEQVCVAVAAWVLEGDAPQDEKDERGCSPSCPSYLNGGHTHPEPDALQEAKGVPVLPGDFALQCRPCGRVTPHRWKPSPEAGDFWRCSECGEPSKAGRYPCSPTCTHDDAATPGHPARVKERSEAVNRTSGFALYSKSVDWEAGYTAGAEEARADVEALKAQVARLTAAGSTLSRYVDAKVGEPAEDAP